MISPAVSLEARYYMRNEQDLFRLLIQVSLQSALGPLYRICAPSKIRTITAKAVANSRSHQHQGYEQHR